MLWFDELIRPEKERKQDGFVGCGAPKKEQEEMNLGLFQEAATYWNNKQQQLSDWVLTKKHGKVCQDLGYPKAQCDEGAKQNKQDQFR